MIDIVMVTFNRIGYTSEVIQHIKDRTSTPHRLIVVDNGSTDGTVAYLYDCLSVNEIMAGDKNRGIHWAHNAGLALVKSKYYISTDNDCLCPLLEPDWIAQLVALMDRHNDFGAISCRPQVMVGSIPGMFDGCDEVKEVSHAGASLRIMRTDAVRKAGGWEKTTNPGRNHEERWIASHLHRVGYRVGYARDIRCFHKFGVNWGYQEIPINEHGHNLIWPLPEYYDKIKCDPETWEPL